VCHRPHSRAAGGYQCDWRTSLGCGSSARRALSVETPKKSDCTWKALQQLKDPEGHSWSSEMKRRDGAYDTRC